MLKAKFICLRYFMYNISSFTLKGIKITCIVSDYSIAKSQYSYHRVGYMSFHCKEHNTRNLHMI